MDWGTQVAVKVSGIPFGTACSIRAVGLDGTAAVAGSWVTDPSEGAVWYTAGTGLRGGGLSGFVVTVSGRPVITIPV
jgi:hypothetical protein